MKRIGRFELRRELGRGAQSVVYLGFDPQLQREIAIKTLHFTRPDPAQNQALLAEARAVGRMRHPSIVPIFEAGEEGGDLYLVFEYVPGSNLAEFLQQSGALPPIKAISILRPILDAILAAASELGEVVVQARKTYVSLVGPRRTFARIQPTTRARVDLALRLENRPPGGRLVPSRIQETMPLQIGLGSPTEVDDEVRALLAAAYEENI